MRTLPASQFLEQMHYFAWALNKNCEFCHVKGEFDSDDKEEKRTAREMIKMTAMIVPRPSRASRKWNALRATKGMNVHCQGRYFRTNRRLEAWVQ